MEYKGQMIDNYADYGITRAVAAWEDGLRADPAGKTYEWWYTDAEYSDGIKAVLVFYTRESFFTFQKPNPTVQLDLTMPDGTKTTQRFSEGKGRLIRASKEKCDVCIGENSIRYEDGSYVVHYQGEGITYDMRMQPTLQMWRPGTGHMNMDGHFFAWLVPVPSADLEATLIVNGVTSKLTGNGYHDHNWGNTDMFNLLNHWYWCRARVAGYTIISSDLITVKKYGYTRYPLFMIAKDGRVLADPETKTTVIREATVIHPVTGKSIDNKLTFINRARDGTEYRVEYLRDHDLTALVTSAMPVSPFVKLINRIKRLDPSYVRCVGQVRLTVTGSDGKQAIYEETGLWEQMFFGSNKAARISDAEE
jgi:hypothetical protein